MFLTTSCFHCLFLDQCVYIDTFFISLNWLLIIIKSFSIRFFICINLVCIIPVYHLLVLTWLLGLPFQNTCLLGLLSTRVINPLIIANTFLQQFNCLVSISFLFSTFSQSIYILGIILGHRWMLMNYGASQSSNSK